ncbi:MAG TPA: S-methyl-5-thioribose kinase [Bacilli bacterium]
MSKYHPLNEEEAIKYAKSIPDLFPIGATLTSREIGDGNLNLVFQIKDQQSGKSVIIKQALPYAKVVGESWPLTLDRARIESDALTLQKSLCPDLVPHVYLFNRVQALTIMEDLSDHVIMRAGLIEQKHYPLFSQHIGSFLANTLFFTSDLGLNQQDKKLRTKQFINPELCKITEDLIFDHPYTDAETNNFEPFIRDEVELIWRDTELHLEVALLREDFLTHAQALLHGDLHTGSIFVTEESTKVIDPEFAFYGPMGFDVGAVLANLLLNFAGQEGWSKSVSGKESFRAELLQMVQEVWEHFEQEFRTLWANHGMDRMAAIAGYQDLYMKRLLQDTMGYTGCKMIRRIIGLAHVADLVKITDPKKRETAERIALFIGKALIKQHRKAVTITEMLDIARESLRQS